MEGTEKIVVDASIAVKWFNLEEYSDIADSMKEAHIKGDIKLIAPSLMIFEVANTLRYNPDLSYVIDIL